MIRVSSNVTLFLTIFVPTFWTVFFGAFTILMFSQPIVGYPFKIGTLIFYLLGLMIFYFTLLRLKRVEMDENGIYTTNYFKHYKYPYHNVETINDSGLLTHITLKTPGHFGKKIWFLKSQKYYESFWQKHPAIAKQFQKEPVGK